MPMSGHYGERYQCKFWSCQAWVLVNKDGSLRAHQYEAGPRCPGSGYKITGSPAVREAEKMHERAVAVGLAE